jgi:uncharacterized DUF497 family protein
MVGEPTVSYEFRWIDWNRDKVAQHDVEPEEAEFVVNHARRPYPLKVDDEKRLVAGQTDSGRYLQVVYLLDIEDTVFVIHARPLTDREKKRLRRRTR